MGEKVKIKKEPLKFGECRMFRAVRVGSGFFAILTQRAVRLIEPLGRYFRQKSTDFHNDRKSKAHPLFCSRIVLPRTRILRLPTRNEKW